MQGRDKVLLHVFLPNRKLFLDPLDEIFLAPTLAVLLIEAVTLLDAIARVKIVNPAAVASVDIRATRVQIEDITCALESRRVCI